MGQGTHKSIKSKMKYSSDHRGCKPKEKFFNHNNNNNSGPARDGETASHPGRVFCAWDGPSAACSPGPCEARLEWRAFPAHAKFSYFTIKARPCYKPRTFCSICLKETTAILTLLYLKDIH